MRIDNIHPQLNFRVCEVVGILRGGGDCCDRFSSSIKMKKNENSDENKENSLIVQKNPGSQRFALRSA